MELKIITPESEKGFIQKIEFNFDELKTQISESLSKYEKLVYSEDSIKEAKEDRAKLNKFKEALETRRKEIKSLCLKPYNEFEAKIKELTGLIDKPILAIDTQVKNFEENKKEAKMSDIISFYEEVIGDLKELLPLEKIFNQKWLNSTVKFAAIEKEMLEKIAKVNGDLKVISDLNLNADIELQVKDKYLTTLDFSIAMAEKTRLENLKDAIQKREQPQEIAQDIEIIQEDNTLIAVPDEQPETVKIYYREFWVKGTKEQLIHLAEYLENNGIQYGGIEKCQSQTA